MTIRTRIFLVYLLLVGGGCCYLLSWGLDSVRPRYLESMEESLVDASRLLASIAGSHIQPGGQFNLTTLRPAIDAAYRQPFEAQVYSLNKTKVDLRLTITDAKGIVIYDSDLGKDEGKDYSQWRDIRLTLEGKYGARATKLDPNDETSLIILVSAPIRAGKTIVGVLTLGKPTHAINSLVSAARRRILIGGLGGVAMIIAAGFYFSVWLTTPIEKLTAYARAIRDGKPATLPRLAGREVGHLHQAFEEMREALEGKKYIESYTQTLTHEIKAPLSAIRGAAELLAEDMPAKDRAHFLANIRTESARIQLIIDKLLQLSAIETRTRHGLEKIERIALADLAYEIAKSFSTSFSARHITLDCQLTESVIVRGERFLLQQAISNLIQNSIEFSPAHSVIKIAIQRIGKLAILIIEDQGPGIPDYALDKIFDRFYSLPRPDTGVKSTGLGLSFVREIALLHDGQIALANRTDTQGCRAELTLPFE